MRTQKRKKKFNKAAQTDGFGWAAVFKFYVSIFLVSL